MLYNSEKCKGVALTKMEKKSFKTLKLVVIIAIIIAIAVILVNKGLEMIEQKKFEDIRTDLLLIQAKIEMIKGKSKVNNNIDAYVGNCVSEYNNDEIKEFLKGINIKEEDFRMYYVLNYQEFENLGIAQNLKDKDDNNIIVNYDTIDVIYKKGVIIDGNTKYRLSEIVEKAEKKIWILHDRMVE